MLRVIEAFSGIGSQKKALDRINVPYEIVNTVEWDINAIIGYCAIHYGFEGLNEYDFLTKEDIVDQLSQYTLSNNGKDVLEPTKLRKMNIEILKRLLFSINRTRDLVSITDVRGEDIDENIDLLTYSFPCQDLSICSAWHGNNTGINRDAANRSGMLWEIERILLEIDRGARRLPRFLLMENVSNILARTHIGNFNEWIAILEGLGYYNKVYKLNANKFGIPQSRERVYMLSILAENQEGIEGRLDRYFSENNLDNYINTNKKKLSDIIKIDYSNEIYRREAEESTPNNTPSRMQIYLDNLKIYQSGRFTSEDAKTVTTKQDRNPNSGVIEYQSISENKAPYRNLTARECFLLMGFDEEDYNKLLHNDFMVTRGRNFFTKEKRLRMAGNSIVVNVLEEIFKQIIYIKNEILENN